MEKTKIKNLKKGEFIRRCVKGSPALRVYVKGDYDRATKSYSCIAYDDINQEIFIKAEKEVFFGFSF